MSRSEWTIESATSILRREPWIEVFEEHIRLPDGRRVDDFYTVKLRDFVVIAPVNEFDQLVGVWHWMRGIKSAAFSIPAGFVDVDETAAAAASRELLEETGYAADTWSDLGSYVVDSNRGCGVAHVFLARGARRVAEPSSTDLAPATVSLISLEEAQEQLARGQIKDMPSACGMALALLRINHEAEFKPKA